MKTTNINEAHNKYTEILHEYFRIIPLHMLNPYQQSLFSDNLTKDQKNKNYELLKPRMSKLKTLFKERTLALNEKAHNEGFANYVEAYLSRNEIPREKYDWFLKNVDNFVSLVMSDDIPVKRLMEEEKDWNMFNTPFPLGLPTPPDKFEIPAQVYGLVAAYDTRADKYKDKIEIKYENEDLLGSAEYKTDKNIVEIRLKPNNGDINSTLGFVDDLGFAFNMLEAWDKGESPLDIPVYVSKYKALEYGMKFQKAYIIKKHQKVLRYNVLVGITMTLFQIDIFTNPNQDFDKAYARAINRCYPMAHQTENPFYVLDQNIILTPMWSLMSNMIEMELYLKDAQSI